MTFKRKKTKPSDDRGVQDMYMDESERDVDCNSTVFSVSRRNQRLDTPTDIVASVLKEAACITEAIGYFAPYVDLISKVFKIGDEIICFYQKAEHHKDICSYLTIRTNAAVASVRDLQIRKTENEEFFSNAHNLKLFEKFTNCMFNIKVYVSEVSQLGGLRKYMLTNTIEERYKELSTEFDGLMQSLNFAIIIKNKVDVAKELEIISRDVSQVKEYLQKIAGGITDEDDNISEQLNKVLMMKRDREQMSPNNRRNFSDEELLNADDYVKKDDKPSRKIQKRIDKTHEEVAFKEFQIQDHNVQVEIRQEVKILKELKGSSHIIKFHGVAKDETKYYLVTEWMEYGNLQEYYRANQLTPNRKFEFALDICRGITYLNAAEILHHDIQPVNMLIDRNHKIKIANFGLSRKFKEVTRNIQPNLENVRYMAPEELQDKKLPYDIKCEIYSIGMVLWEIAETKKPFESIKNDFQKIIVRVVKHKEREKITAEVPEIWKTVVTLACQHDKMDRPPISTIFSLLYNYYDESRVKRPRTPLPSNDNPFVNNNCKEDYMEVDGMDVDGIDDAIREHKQGDKQKAWKYFCKYANEGNVDALYWKGYYLYHGEIPELQVNDKKNLAVAANLFKMAADKGKPEAQLKYGSCLWDGKGVPTDKLEALKYQEKAAIQGNLTAMYNVGSAYYNGIEFMVDKEKGSKYLQKAANKKHAKAIEMCEKNNIH
ncbi:9366_t:CDS:2 [Diversispora eburnea]|uniref:9366_t:CDS:1 n=1 Tax=Diversispora eburnea TaxID=1213867 RepID=A0A9N8V1R5_9GLOM|nr:9366_t:CDS:2 [Diversispora eburnea]